MRPWWIEMVFAMHVAKAVCFRPVSLSMLSISNGDSYTWVLEGK